MELNEGLVKKRGDDLADFPRGRRLVNFGHQVSGHIEAWTKVRVVQLRQHHDGLVRQSVLLALCLLQVEMLAPPDRRLPRPRKATIQLTVHGKHRLRVVRQIVGTSLVDVGAHDHEARIWHVGVGSVCLKQRVGADAAEAVAGQPDIVAVLARSRPAHFLGLAQGGLDARVKRGAERRRCARDDAQALEDARDDRPELDTGGRLLNGLHGCNVVLIGNLTTGDEHEHLFGAIRVHRRQDDVVVGGPRGGHHQSRCSESPHRHRCVLGLVLDLDRRLVTNSPAEGIQTPT
mmetsp:Transcript_48940/g.157436  ORF Transcript_48940/g.157436 Transcript_48940/m.157436 type:complete len:289 (+) Transcript_48940:1088-1954(+)